MGPVKGASEMLYEVIVVSLFTHLLTPALLVAPGVPTHSYALTLTCLCSSPRISEQRSDCSQSKNEMVF